jgi:tetratricopeptide (TPR) repeat protein
MTDWRSAQAIVAATVAAIVATTALAVPAAVAQAPDQPSPPAATGEPAPGAEPEPEHAAAPPDSPQAEAERRQVQLDALFTRLAEADGKDWQGIQSEIWALWSRSGSASMDLLLQRASQAMEAQDLELALRFLNDLVRLAPDFAEGWNKRATVYFLLGEYGHSVADIEHTLALEPRHFGALGGLGMILERLGNKEGAMQAYRRGLEIHPNLPGAVEGVERLSKDVDGQEL